MAVHLLEVLLNVEGDVGAGDAAHGRQPVGRALCLGVVAVAAAERGNEAAQHLLLRLPLHAPCELLEDVVLKIDEGVAAGQHLNRTAGSGQGLDGRELEALRKTSVYIANCGVQQRVPVDGFAPFAGSSAVLLGYLRVHCR